LIDAKVLSKTALSNGSIEALGVLEANMNKFSANLILIGEVAAKIVQLGGSGQGQSRHALFEAIADDPGSALTLLQGFVK